jgi:hypothetical protein
VPDYGYVVDKKARVALERALRNPRKRVMGVEWESKLTFGFYDVPDYGFAVPNKARVALERTLRNPRKRAMGACLTMAM